MITKAEFIYYIQKLLAFEKQQDKIHEAVSILNGCTSNSNIGDDILDTSLKMLDQLMCDKTHLILTWFQLADNLKIPIDQLYDEVYILNNPIQIPDVPKYAI